MTATRHTTSLHPATVTAHSQGHTPTYTRVERPTGTWNSTVARSQVDDRLLAGAIHAAGGDVTRLWFDGDGSVWVLNHARGQHCPSPACPPCTAGSQR